MKKCIFLHTHHCPFDDSDQGPPFAGSISSCSALRNHIYCPYRNDMKHAPEFYARNMAAMRGQQPASGLTFMIKKFMRG
jgi:hypothetical protein